MIFVITPPLVSMPRLSGVTSSSRTSLTSPFRTPACSEAPSATTSSGLTPLCGSLPRQLLDQVGDGRHTGGAAHQDDLVDLVHRGVGVLDDGVEGSLAAVQQVLGHALELGARELLVQVQRARGAGRDVGQVDLGLLRGAQLDLGALGGLLQTLRAILSLLRSTPLAFLNCVTSQSTMR
jgi:hypothetical protein